ncbi:MAG TPA: MarR family winged helix-turn-helix transcriptional regulator [Solirubrobacteraceae bacterium]|jgi:DNA-binding MarR family transcriptional regulator|nr:MarR family winged helix-turn-helix transcriptional regulator [Solirubrobacteraceae bacterium]
MSATSNRRSTPRTAKAPAGRTAGAVRAPAPQVIELGQAFRRVFRTLNRLRGRDTHLGGQELSQAQFELLAELDERGELSAGELAAAARLTPATVTQMLDHLAACGHVERTRSETDRRVVVSRLTPDGRRRLQAKREAWRIRWDDALADVPVEDLEAATRVLERLGAMFEQAPPADA